MNEDTEYVSTHSAALLAALVIARGKEENEEDKTFWQHEINALVDEMRRIQGKTK